MQRDQIGEFPVTPRTMSRILAVSNLFLFGFFLFALGSAGLFEPAWGWIVVVVGALFFVGDFFLPRYVFIDRMRKIATRENE